MTTLTNWNHSAQSHPDALETPTSTGEVVRIVRDVAGHRSPVRATGHLHSTTFCIEADGGTQLDMRGLDRVDPGTDGRRITVGAGVTMLKVRDALRPHGRELPVSPEIGNATAGSAACSGSKDSWLRTPGQPDGLAQIGSAVAQVKMVDARGRVMVIDETGATDEETGQRDPALTLDLVRCSYGLLGVIVEVTFETVPLRLLHNRFAWLPVAAPFESSRPDTDIRVPSVAEVFDGADAVLAFLQPYHGGLLVERRRVLGAGERATPEDEVRRRVRDWIWEWGASQGTTGLTALSDILTHGDPAAVRKLLTVGLEGVFGSLTDFVLRPVLRLDAPRLLAKVLEQALEKLGSPGRGGGAGGDGPVTAALLRLFDLAPQPFFEGLLRGYRAHRSDSLVDFTDRRETFFDFTFWAFPESTWPEIVPEYLKFCRDHARRNDDYRPALFTEIYFLPRDRRSRVSFSADGPAFTLDMVDNRPSDERWKAMNRAYNRWAVEHGGRPVLNQTKELPATPEVVRQAYATTWAAFSRDVWTANPPLPGAPDGRFVSRYFAALLDPRR